MAKLVEPPVRIACCGLGSQTRLPSLATGRTALRRGRHDGVCLNPDGGSGEAGKSRAPASKTGRSLHSSFRTPAPTQEHHPPLMSSYTHHLSRPQRVLLPDYELPEIQRFTRRERLTLGEGFAAYFAKIARTNRQNGRQRGALSPGESITSPHIPRPQPIS
jgi:hypothetical protein